VTNLAIGATKFDSANHKWVVVLFFWGDWTEALQQLHDTRSEMSGSESDANFRLGQMEDQRIVRSNCQIIVCNAVYFS